MGPKDLTQLASHNDDKHPDKMIGFFVIIKPQKFWSSGNLPLPLSSIYVWSIRIHVRSAWFHDAPIPIVCFTLDGGDLDCYSECPPWRPYIWLDSFNLFYSDWKLLQNILEVRSMSNIGRSDPRVWNYDWTPLSNWWQVLESWAETASSTHIRAFPYPLHAKVA